MAVSGDGEARAASDLTEEREARKARRQARRRRRIVDAARQILVTDGFDALTAASLAAATDMSVPSLYYYFDSFDDIVESVAIGLITEEADALVAAVTAAPDGPAALEALVRTRVAWYVARPEAWRLVELSFSSVRLSPRGFAEGVYPAASRVNDPVEAMLLEDQRRGLVSSQVQPRRLANVAFCTAQGILAVSLGIARMGGGMRFPVDALVDEACRSLRAGCRPAVVVDEAGPDASGG